MSRKSKATTQGQRDEFQPQYLSNVSSPELEVSPTVTKLQAETGSASHSGVECYKNRTSDTNSEEILLHELEPARGIIRTTEYTVKYSGK